MVSCTGFEVAALEDQSFSPSAPHCGVNGHVVVVVVAVVVVVGGDVVVAAVAVVVVGVEAESL